MLDNKGHTGQYDQFAGLVAAQHRFDEAFSKRTSATGLLISQNDLD
jgi:hypothetical protein